MKDSFIFYTAYAEKFKRLSDLQFGQFVRALVTYQATGSVPEIADTVVGMAFDVAKIEIDAANSKYLEMCEQRREAGRKGGQASKPKQTEANESKPKQTEANESKPKQTETKPTYNDNENENDNNIYTLTARAHTRIEETDSEPEKPTAMDLFNEFWSAYPYKVARIAAEQAWARLNPTPELAAEIIAGVKLHREKNESWRREKGRYIPKPETFLADQRWRDQLPEELPELPEPKPKSQPPEKEKPKPGSFSDFPQRDHDEDYFAELERRKLAESVTRIGGAK
ncbi:MAG: hypothetical protein J5787_05950 [Alphaproteobacteria bacterium]|nr:hypothetical protein [Alphaproteobacteria bacterium]